MEKAKEAILKLVERYESAKREGKLKSYSEEETKKDFILPLFQALGWDVFEKNEVTAEEQISGDRVDYGFYLNGRIKFYLEAKKFSVDLHREEYAKQAIRYSWNKGVTWAILTDFETLIIFNALSPEKSLAGKKYLSFTCQEYLTRFDELWRLSKVSFAEELLDKEAEKVGKKLQKISVTEKLAKDLNDCRKLLTEAFTAWNQKVPEHLIDEGVQKLLDRLIFIRVAEDRKIEPQILLPLIHQWKASGKAGATSPYQAMVEKFRYLDGIYNSNLFSPHPFEQWEEFSGATEKAIEILYGDKDYFEYDFSIIPADVLGAVYENYLGYKLEQSKKTLFGQDLDLAKDKRKRKEHGIYYTPRFIVEYIVQNALGPVLDKCKSINDLQKVRVLDPACGSGSFLIAAFEKIIKKYEEFGAKNEPFLKIQILGNNIFGVDLDEQAVELARLNLLLAVCDSQIKLPNLANNIKNGNSLISGIDQELEKYFGKNYRDKKPFNWQEQFPEVFAQGGFDCIIGNPPYIKEDTNKEAFDGLHDNQYYQGKMDIWTMFGCICIDLLKANGFLGFIAPSNWVSNFGASLFREKILSDGEISDYVDFGDYKVFDNASIQTMILTYQKRKPRESYEMNYVRITDKDIAPGSLVEILHGKDKGKIQLKPNELKGKFLNFSAPVNESILTKIKQRQNYKLKDDSIGNGIDVLQDFVNKKHEIALNGKVKKGDGILILSDSEIQHLKTNAKENEYLRPYYTTEQINRYLALPGSTQKIIYADPYFRSHITEFPNLQNHIDRFKNILTSAFAPYGLHRAREERFFEGQGLFAIRKTKRPAFAYVDFPCYVTRAFLVLKPSDVNLKYLLGILNSSLVNFWLKNKGKLQGDQLQIDKEPLLDLPIFIVATREQKTIIALVDKMLDLNKKYKSTVENSNEWQKIQDEITKTDQKIDQEVYKLYGLTDEEIKIVEA